jgi:hypothetical protein
VEAHVYRGTIDEPVYRRQDDKLSEEIAFTLTTRLSVSQIGVGGCRQAISKRSPPLRLPWRRRQRIRTQGWQPPLVPIDGSVPPLLPYGRN